MMPRLSMLPGKQAIYILLARDGRLSQGKTVGVDFGCGASRPTLPRSATNFAKEADEVVVLDSIIRKMSPGGTLLVTFAPKRGWRDMIEKLNGSFSQVTQIGLDLPNRPQTPLAPLIAIKHLRNTTNPEDWPSAKSSDRGSSSAKLPEWRRVYCRCEGKVAAK